MSYSHHSDNTKFGLALAGLALVCYGLFRALVWLVVQLQVLFTSF